MSAAKNSKNPLCYNGDITDIDGIRRIEEEFPHVGSIMIGRGLIADPGMLSGGSKEKLEAFHNALLEEYTIAFGGSRNAMFRLKENWHFLITRFLDSEKLWKRLRKTTDIAEFRSITAEIFHTLEMQ